MEILSRFPAIPKRKRQATNSPGVRASPRRGKVNAYNRAEPITTGLLPNLATSHPAIGRDTNNPVGKPSSTPPRTALLRCNFDWMPGMRDAQLEKHNPARKKKQLTDIL
jgi:hypothetical protein